MGLKDRDHVQQKVTKIGRVQLFQPRLILCVELWALLIVRTRICCGYLVRRQRAVLPAIDDRGQLPRGPALVVNPGGRDELLEQAQLIV